MQLKTFSFILLIGATLLASGCATNRGVVDIRMDIPTSVASAEAVKIVRIYDDRVFELKPREASIPSLKNGEINNKAITSRAVARKRNGWGKALGDILLPEGRTVSDLIEETVGKAFIESGYRIVGEKDPDYMSAKPVEVNVDRLWTYITMGFWSLGLNFESNIKITGGAPVFEGGKEISSQTQLRTQAATTRAWKNILNTGLKDLLEKIKLELNSDTAENSGDIVPKGPLKNKLCRSF